MPRNYYRHDEWAEARQEKIDDFRRFNDNEAAIENERFERASAEEARKARVAKYLAECGESE
jgi:hypothetical protein